MNGLNIAIFGSSLVSSYWNGSATYFRGIVRALHERGHQITFFEPDLFDRHHYRDIADPDWATVVIYPAKRVEDGYAVIEQACGFDVVIKASGLGVFDEFLEEAVLDLQRPETVVIFWDLHAPVTLERVQADPFDPFRSLIPRYDLVLTCGGGEPIVWAYGELGVKTCMPIYAALDPALHQPTLPDAKYVADLSFMGNRLFDRELRVDEFFLSVAQRLPQYRFLLGGSGWEDKPFPDNVSYLGHVGTADHNAFNCSARAILNISREVLAHYGFSPSARIFEAAGASACLITDEWDGLELFFDPGEEILVASSGDQVLEHLASLTLEQAQKLGKAAQKRVLAEHTYSHRVAQLEAVLDVKPAG